MIDFGMELQAIQRLLVTRTIAGAAVPLQTPHTGYLRRRQHFKFPGRSSIYRHGSSTPATAPSHPSGERCPSAMQKRPPYSLYWKLAPAHELLSRQLERH